MLTLFDEKKVVGQYIQPEVPAVNNPSVTPDPITVGEALETAALSAADKEVEQSDVAAIQAAERRATGINETLPGGVAAEAQYAATRNARTMRFEDKTTLSDVLSVIILHPKQMNHKNVVMILFVNKVWEIGAGCNYAVA